MKEDLVWLKGFSRAPFLDTNEVFDGYELVSSHLRRMLILERYRAEFSLMKIDILLQREMMLLLNTDEELKR